VGVNFRVGVATRAAAAAARPAVRMRCCRRLLIGLGEGRVRATWYDANLQPMPVRPATGTARGAHTDAGISISVRCIAPPHLEPGAQGRINR